MRKKNTVTVNGTVYKIERDYEIQDLNQEVENLIHRETEKTNGMKKSECLNVMGVPQTTFSSWKKSREAAEQRKLTEAGQLLQGMERFITIIHKLSYIPGKRTFKAVYKRMFHENISVKRCRRIMEYMNLEAYRPKKDAYKKQALHNHECIAPADLVGMNFRIWPRTVILTDITYFYYGRSRTPFYLCSFLDAYTKELLGSAVSTKMSVESLVKPAYDRMMSGHASELNRAECVVHHDQGSQYLSTSFRELLKNDRILQSVSRRGCCKDNAPMESFWSRMKTHLLDTVALAMDYQTAKEMVENYIHAYNTENIQYSLGGLTPEDYYQYTMTGVYPMERYFGVDAERLMSVAELKKLREERARKKKEYEEGTEARSDARGKATAGHLKAKGPLAIVNRDYRLIRILYDEAVDREAHFREAAEKYEKLLERISAARDYLKGIGEEERSRFMIKDEWKTQPELDYIFEMDQLFA